MSVSEIAFTVCFTGFVLAGILSSGRREKYVIKPYGHYHRTSADLAGCKHCQDAMRR